MMIDKIYGGRILRTAIGISLIAILLLTGLANAQGAMYPEAKAIVLSEDSNITVTFEGSVAAFNNSRTYAFALK